MRGKLITIFGGTGFVGSYLVPKLTEQGALIRTAVRNVDDALYLKTSGYVGQVELVPVNMKNETSIERAIEGSDYVVNLIGILNGSKRAFEYMHVQVPKIIGSLSSKHNVKRLVHVSAIGADRDSSSVYASTKGLGEVELMKAFPEATILRPSIIFGPEDDFFNRFADMATMAPFLPVIAGGKTQVQPVYVGDVAEAISHSLTDSQAGSNPHASKIYELGGPAVYTFKELMSYILKTIERRRMLINIPYPLAMIMGSFLGLIPNAPLTRDQVKMLKKDNIVNQDSLSLRELNIEPTALEMIVPEYLKRFRMRG